MSAPELTLDVDPRCCPLCGATNSCAMAAGDDAPCWCRNVKFPRELLDRVPPAARGVACVCRACAEAHPESH